MHYRCISEGSIRNYCLGSRRTFHQDLTAFPVSVARSPRRALSMTRGTLPASRQCHIPREQRLRSCATPCDLRDSHARAGGNDFAMGYVRNGDRRRAPDLLLTAYSGLCRVTGDRMRATGRSDDMAAAGIRRFAWTDNGPGAGGADSHGHSDCLPAGCRDAFLIPGSGRSGVNGALDLELGWLPAIPGGHPGTCVEEGHMSL